MSDTLTQPLAAPVARPLVPGDRVGPFRVVRKLGEGGMGVVYEALQESLDRPVALKVMRPELAADPQFSGRFLREARTAASVCHQHLVVLFDAGSVDGRPYMAFQFVPGGDLDQLLKAGPLTPARAVGLIAACADGLQALHEAGLVHRDIKPHNIFLDAHGRPKLGDFGLARSTAGEDRLTVTGVGMGTPAYMAPEQAQGAADLDIRADIHALGATLYTLLTGTTPFSGDTAWMVANAVINQPPPDPRARRPEIPPSVAALCLTAMAKDRAERFQTPAELREAALAILTELEGEPARPVVRRPGRPDDHRLWWWLAPLPVTLLLVPTLMAPLVELNPGVTVPTLGSPPAWGAWLGWTVAGSLATAVVLADRLKPRQATLWLLGGGALTLAALLVVAHQASRALSAALGSHGSTAMVLATVAAGVGWLGVILWRLLRHRSAGPGPLFLLSLAPTGLLLLATLSAHLLQPTPAAPAEDTRLPIIAFLDRRPPPVAATAQSPEPARALLFLVPLSLALLVPALARRRVTPGR